MFDKYILKKSEDSTILINKYNTSEIYFFEGVSKLIIDNINESQNNIVNMICDKYDVDKETATNDYEEFMSSLQNFSKVETELVDYNKFNKLLGSNGIYECTIELTNNCPFKCDHCYVPKEKKINMNFSLFKYIIDELYLLKVPRILLTGGDPLINPYFNQMYEYAKEKGIIVYINTTLFSVKDDIYNLFKKYKPDGLEVSIYGYDDLTYKNFVHVDSAYQHVIKNLEKIKKLGVNIKLKTVLTKKNYKYIGKIKQIAKKLELPYRYDYILFPKINEIGIKNKEAITPAQIIEVIKQDENDINYFKEAVNNIKKIKGNYVPSENVFQCSIGKERIFIDVDGNIKLCLVVPQYINIKNKSISSAINILNNSIKLLTFVKNDKCYKCYKKKICRYCPGRFFLETRSYTTPPDFYCELADMIIKEFDN